MQTCLELHCARTSNSHNNSSTTISGEILLPIHGGPVHTRLFVRRFLKCESGAQDNKSSAVWFDSSKVFKSRHVEESFLDCSSWGRSDPSPLIHLQVRRRCRLEH